MGLNMAKLTPNGTNLRFDKTIGQYSFAGYAQIYIDNFIDFRKSQICLILCPSSPSFALSDIPVTKCEDIDSHLG